MYILDTDHISLVERGTGADAQRLRFRLAALTLQERATTIITFEEQMRGWMAYLARSRALANQLEAYGRLQRTLTHYCKITVLEFDKAAADEFQRLQLARLRVGTMDLKIAAIALAHDAVLLSRNLKDFNSIPKLRVEDWSL